MPILTSFCYTHLLIEYFHTIIDLKETIQQGYYLKFLNFILIRINVKIYEICFIR